MPGKCSWERFENQKNNVQIILGTNMYWSGPKLRKGGVPRKLLGAKLVDVA